MANTIKVIDLLNKIANGEEVPEKIKFDKTIWEYNINDYLSTGNVNLYFFKELIVFNEAWLTDTVEIIEEQQDIDIQKIEELDKEWTYVEGLVEKTWSVAELEIIENLNKLASAVKQLDRNIKDKE